VSAQRTVTVQTSDHGPVTLPEPSWCLGNHPHGGYRSDIQHEGQLVSVHVDTPCCGPVAFLESGLAQWPFASRNTRPFIAVEFASEVLNPDRAGDDHELDHAGLDRLAEALAAYALYTVPQLREVLAAALEEAGA
jgi:hypothetical protein